ncbi:hypothetical protein XHC_0036 [Xanthomonas hortorum pv. carotae str. M081]|nr:hypothetical protein XHC_0036 [Xanthomonas hortorum pv. carotae str. M081]
MQRLLLRAVICPAADQADAGSARRPQRNTATPPIAEHALHRIPATANSSGHRSCKAPAPTHDLAISAHTGLHLSAASTIAPAKQV